MLKLVADWDTCT